MPLAAGLEKDGVKVQAMRVWVEIQQKEGHTPLHNLPKVSHYFEISDSNS